MNKYVLDRLQWVIKTVIIMFGSCLKKIHDHRPNELFVPQLTLITPSGYAFTLLKNYFEELTTPWTRINRMSIYRKSLHYNSPKDHPQHDNKKNTQINSFHFDRAVSDISVAKKSNKWCCNRTALYGARTDLVKQNTHNN